MFPFLSQFLLLPILSPLLSQQPVAQLIRQTARHQWRLITLNLGSSLVEAFSEGASLTVVFLSVEVLMTPTATPYNWQSKSLLNLMPGMATWLNGLPPTATFLSLLALAVLLQLLQSFCRFLGELSVSYFAARCRSQLTAKIHGQVLSFSFPCASSYKVGDLTDHSAIGPSAIERQIQLSSNLLVGSLLIATYMTVLITISPWLLLAVVMIVGLITMVQRLLLPRIIASSKALSKIQVEISSRITENFQGLRLLHSTGQLEQADQSLRAGMGELERQLRGQGRRLAVVGPFSSLLPILAIAVIAAISLFLLGGRNSGLLPSLVTFVLSLQRLNLRLNITASALNGLADNSGRLDRLNQILSPAGKQFRRIGGTPFISLQREISLQGVSLNYAPELPPALSDISFTLPRGRMIALVGPSGAGKSSIADLLTGLYTPTAGEIRIDGIPLDHLELASWQRRLGIVSQDTFLFNATIAENVAFGTHGARQQQIEAACQAAQAAGFIESFPRGYDTLVGERGYRLSGGQRQRLSLARAILRDPELLILDEATSALDSNSERLVQQAIERFERGHTVLVIAHRLSTIVGADQILVLDQGRVVESGTHTKLLTQRGLYSQLWAQQSKQSLPYS